MGRGRDREGERGMGGVVSTLNNIWASSVRHGSSDVFQRSASLQRNPFATALGEERESLLSRRGTHRLGRGEGITTKIVLAIVKLFLRF